MSPHPHAKAMMEYAEDAAETDKPWERWELTGGSVFVACNVHPNWDVAYRYRRKPKPLECWARLYSDGSFCLHKTRGEAESMNESTWQVRGRIVHMREVKE